MDKRDPRTDPQRGDWTVTRPKNRVHGNMDWYWLVIAREGECVTYMAGDGVQDSTTLQGWIEASEDDEVLHVAE